jgi:arylformamidase
MIIDLSHIYHAKMQTYSKWHSKFKLLKLASIKKQGRETKKIIMGSHCGTHIDAPRHFLPSGKTIEKINVNNLIGLAEIIKFKNMPKNYEISCEDLINKIKFKNLKKIIFNFGWDKFYGKKKFYKDHPFLSLKACEWLVANKYHLIGMDSAQIEDCRIKSKTKFDGQNHKILLKSGIILLEYLKNLDKIKKKKFKLLVAPLNLKGSDGSPARCFAI